MTIEEQYNLNELYEKLNALVGIPLTWTAEIKKAYNKQEYLSIKSNNIEDKAGVMSLVYKELCLKTFNSSFTDNNEFNHKVWMTVNFDFSYKSGGSNGCDFVNCWLMNDGHWIIMKRWED